MLGRRLRRPPFRLQSFLVPDGCLEDRDELRLDLHAMALLDERKRKELMIIYGEDLGSTGLSAADLSQGGKAFGQWPAIEKTLLERAQEKIAIQQNPDVR